MKRTGWLVLETNSIDEPLKAIEFLEDQLPDDEPPYSNDEGVIQFHLEIDFSTEYPTARVID